MTEDTELVVASTFNGAPLAEADQVQLDLR